MRIYVGISSIHIAIADGCACSEMNPLNYLCFVISWLLRRRRRRIPHQLTHTQSNQIIHQLVPQQNKETKEISHPHRIPMSNEEEEEEEEEVEEEEEDTCLKSVFFPYQDNSCYPSISIQRNQIMHQLVPQWKGLGTKGNDSWKSEYVQGLTCIYHTDPG